MTEPGPNDSADKHVVNVHREAYDFEAAKQATGRRPKQEKSVSENLNNVLSGVRYKPKSWTKFFNHFLPITGWLFNYKWREDLLADVIGGITIGIMHIPQGLAYATLANSPPIIGIYTGVFPVIIYVLFGPSRHVSIGTNPLTAILIGNIVTKTLGNGGGDGGDGDWTTPDPDWGSSTPASTGTISESSSLSSGMSGFFSVRSYDPEPRNAEDDLWSDPAMQVVTTLGLLGAIWQMGLSVLQFGKLSWIMSEILVSAYTCSASVHVVVSQLKGITGIPVKSYSGPLNMFYAIIEVFDRIEETNVACIIISAITMTVLIINDELLKPRLAKLCSIPLPIQLIVVVFGTAFGFAFDMEERWGVPIVGEMPSGFTPPVAPPTSMFSSLVLDSLIVAMVGYCVTLSMAKLFAAKLNYSIDGNQELFSEGLANLFASFFSCMPASASMARTSVQVLIGGRTQLLSVVSIVLLVLVIFFLTFLFHYLPLCVLASIILVALKTMLFQMQDLPRYWRLSKIDGLLWVGIFCATILLDIDLGLIVGFVLNLLVLVYNSYSARVSEVAVADGTGLCVEVKSNENALRRSGTTVVAISGDVNFANFESIIDKLRKKLKTIPVQDQEVVIVDLSNVPQVDQSGALALKNWLEGDSASQRVLAAPSAFSERMLLRQGTSPDRLFPSVMDALALVRPGEKESRANGHANASFVHEEEGGAGRDGRDVSKEE